MTHFDDDRKQLLNSDKNIINKTSFNRTSHRRRVRFRRVFSVFIAVVMLFMTCALVLPARAAGPDVISEQQEQPDDLNSVSSENADLETEEISKEDISSVSFFDITFQKDGEEIETTGDANITLTMKEEIEGNVQIVCLPEGKDAQVLEATVDGIQNENDKANYMQVAEAKHENVLYGI